MRKLLNKNNFNDTQFLKWVSLDISWILTDQQNRIKSSPTILGSISFQSKAVKGAQKSEFLLLFKRHSNLASESLWKK